MVGGGCGGAKEDGGGGHQSNRGSQSPTLAEEQLGALAIVGWSEDLIVAC